MAKKKQNRKKQVKFHQKRGIEQGNSDPIQYIEEVLLLNQEGEYERFEIERRRLHMTNPFYRATTQLAEEGDLESMKDPAVLKDSVNDRTFPFTEIHGLFVDAFDHRNDLNQLQKDLMKILDKDPNNLEARYYLHYHTNYSSATQAEFIDLHREMEEQAWDLWKKEGFGDWQQFNSRLPLSVFCYLIQAYIDYGLDALAFRLVERIVAKPMKRLPATFLNLALTSYNRTYQYEKLLAFSERLAEPYRRTDTYLVHMSFAHVLAGELEAADRTFDMLEKRNPATEFFFSDLDWIDTLVEVEAEDTVHLYSYESLQNACLRLVTVYEESRFLIEYLENRYGEDHPFEFDFFDDEDLEDRIAFMEKEVRRMELEEFDAARRISEIKHLQESIDVSFDRARTFYNEGIQTKADFSRFTEKELLSLRGIGAGTIKKIKDAGARLKD